MVAAQTTLPVIGVPIQSKTLNGLDSLLSIVQMPAGIPVATVAIGEAGAKNAGLLAASIIAIENPTTHQKLNEFQNFNNLDFLQKGKNSRNRCSEDAFDRTRERIVKRFLTLIN